MLTEHPATDMMVSTGMRTFNYVIVTHHCSILVPHLPTDPRIDPVPGFSPELRD